MVLIQSLPFDTPLLFLCLFLHRPLILRFSHSQYQSPCQVKEKERIGEVTSGTLSPSLGRGIGIGYVKTEVSTVGEEIDIEIRGGYQKAKIVSTPFYKGRG